MFRHWFALGDEGRARRLGGADWGKIAFRAWGLVFSAALIGGALVALPNVAFAQGTDSSVTDDGEYDFRVPVEALDTLWVVTPAEELSAEGLPDEDIPSENTPAEDLSVEDVSAEESPDEETPAETSAEDTFEAAPPDTGDVPQISTEGVAPGFDFKLSQMPPLPSGRPVAGPPVTPSATDDVDRRTTAFMPTDLSMLTEIEMPDVEEDERWIRVDLSEQMVIAYEGLKPVRGFIVSTGLPGTPTVTGVFRIRTKVRSQTMTGGSLALGTYYNLPNVEWVQYFYADYGFHGTYWHNNFGQPMSHGCINMTNADAKWLFDWAGPKWDGKTIWYAASASNPGALVIVHE